MSQRLNRSAENHAAGSTFVESLESRTLLSTVKNIPGLLVRNPDVWPSNDRMVFNKITHKDAIRPNVTHDVGSILITNTTSKTMVLDNVFIVKKAKFKMVRGGGTDIHLAPHQTLTVMIRFAGVGTADQLVTMMGSSLRIISGGKTDSVVMAGLWQAYSEQTTTQPHTYGEPSLSTLVNSVFGFKKVSVASAAQETTKGLLVELGTHGSRTAVGSEVMSSYWTAANAALPVKVQMIAAWHRQNNFDQTTGAPITAAAALRYFYKGASGTLTNLFTHNINEGQSVVPHMSNSTTDMAAGSFMPTAGKSFGFKIDNRYTDDNLNPQDFNPSNNQKYANTGHAVRFFPLKSNHGTPIPDAYIMAMDYTGLSYSNYDYQDNIYIVSNIKPASTGSSAAARPAAVATATATTSTSTAFSATPVRDDAASVLSDDGASATL